MIGLELGEGIHSEIFQSVLVDRAPLAQKISRRCAAVHAEIFPTYCATINGVSFTVFLS